jgi:hypothetical protein
MHDADFQTDPVALDVSELWEGLYGDIDGSLDRLIDQQRQQLGRMEGRKEHTS